MNNLERALRTQNKGKQNRVQELSGTMGVVLNGSQVVEVPNRAGFVYVLLNAREDELVQAFNDKVSSVFGLAVIVVWKVNRYEVIRKDDLRYGTWNSNYLPKHGSQHSFNPEGGGGGDVTFIYGKQFVPLSLYPSGAFGAPVAIVAGYAQQNSGWHYVPDTVTPNLVSYKPTDSNARMVLVCMNWNTQDVQVILGTGSFSSNLTGTADVIQYLPSTTGSLQIPIAGVRLVSGTSSITWRNIYDVRQFFHPIITGSSSGVGGGESDDTYLRLDAANDPLTNSLDIVTPNSSYGIYGIVTHAANAYFDQLADNTITDPSIFVDRYSTGTVAAYTEAAYYVRDNVKSAGFRGGTVKHVFYSGSSAQPIPITDINPYANSLTGTVFLLDSQTPISPTGTFLLFNRQGREIFRINGSGTALSNGVPLIKEAPADGTSYARINNGWASITGSAGGSGGRTLIQEITPGATGTASFTSIPATYQTLEIEYVIRSTRAASVFDELRIRFNGDNTATNYRFTEGTHFGAGNTTAAAGENSTIDNVPAASSPANSVSTGIVDIPFYKATTFNKNALQNSTMRQDTSSNHQVIYRHGVEWENTAAINRIDLILGSGNFVSGSTIRLYGKT